MNTELTFDEFAPSSYPDWRKEAEATLEGAPFEKKLVSQTPESLPIQPIYNHSDITGLPQTGSFPGFQPFVRGSRASGSLARPWDVAQFLAQPSAAAFNTAARNALERGQTALLVTPDRATRLGLDPDQASPGDVGFCGLSISTIEDFRRMLDGIDLRKTALYLQGGSANLSIFALFAGYVTKKGLAPEQIRGALDQDPFGELVADGALPHSLDTAFTSMARVTRWALENAPQFGTIGIRTYPYSDAGSTAVQDLAFALATAVDYLRRMEEHGLPVDEVAPRMRFSFSIGADFFMAIAQLRAARMLWARVIEACNGGERSSQMRIHARTSLWNKSGLDPHVNMLRVTTEALAAVLGGCESLQTGAFDEVVRPADEFSRRIARNTQLILRDECHAHRVIDPSGGSWFVEKLTDDLARAAWALFQKIEGRGGMQKALAEGFPQAEVETAAAKKREAVEHRRLSLLGVNLYANPGEDPLPPGDWQLHHLQSDRASAVEEHRTTGGQEENTGVLASLAKVLDASPETVVNAAIESAIAGATLGELARTLRSGDDAPASAPRLAPRRGAEPFEQLRAAVRAYTRTTGSRPRVFLANMGKLGQHKARADFSAGFFETAGFQTVSPAGFETPSHAADAALADSAKVVVICSTDDTYPELVPPIAKAIKAAHPEKVVYVAGYPADHLDAFREAGVDDFIHLRANCYRTLYTLLTRLGIIQ